MSAIFMPPLLSFLCWLDSKHSVVVPTTDPSNRSVPLEFWVIDSLLVRSSASRSAVISASRLSASSSKFPASNSLLSTDWLSISLSGNSISCRVGKELLYARVTLRSESVSVLTMSLLPAVTVSPWNPSAEALDVGSPVDAFDVGKTSVNGGAGMILVRLHFTGVVDDVDAVPGVKATNLGTVFFKIVCFGSGFCKSGVFQSAIEMEKE
ncbi:hypothetical protein GQX74_012081 [Glossina fuscipes]|nr:hypothetical protein GQX74_012081 [Glossina fuscipes]